MKIKRHRLAFVLALLATAILCFALARVVTAQSGDVNVQYTGQYAPIVSSVSLQNFSAGTPGASSYFYFNTAAQNAITFYVTNNSNTTTHAVTIKTLYSGSPNSPSPSTNGSQWVGLQTTVLASGGAGGVGAQGTTQVLSLAHNGTAALASNITSAAFAAVNISNADVSVDTFSVYAVVVPNGGSGISQVQGTTPAGQAATSNPVTAGCVGNLSSEVTASGTNLYVPCDNTQATGYGLLIGHAQGTSQGQTYSNDVHCLWDSNQPCGPLLVQQAAPNSTGVNQAIGISNGFANSGSELVTQGGQYKSVTATYTVNTSTTIQNFSQATAGIMLGCTVIIDVAGPVTGTTPSLSLIFQDSDGVSGTFQDRIAFNPFTTAGFQRAVIYSAPNTGIVPYVPSSGSLAAGTIVNGPVLPTTRILATVSGTTPSFGNVTTFQNCW